LIEQLGCDMTAEAVLLAIVLHDPSIVMSRDNAKLKQAKPNDSL